mgnify:CR=1 FL=1
MGHYFLEIQYLLPQALTTANLCKNLLKGLTKEEEIEAARLVRQNLAHIFLTNAVKEIMHLLLAHSVY